MEEKARFFNVGDDCGKAALFATHLMTFHWHNGRRANGRGQGGVRGGAKPITQSC